MSNSGNDIEQILAPFLTFEQTIIQPLSSLLVIFALYGIYVTVFGLSIHILSRHNGPSSRLYIGWSISLFVLATLYTVVEAWGLSRQTVIKFKAATTKNYEPFLKYATFDEGELLWDLIDGFVSFTMEVISQSMLVHRCCVIWQSRIMTYLLVFFVVVLNVIDLGVIIAEAVGLSIPNYHLYDKTAVIDNGIGIAFSIFQVLLALLTGGRIWWISQPARHLMGQSINARYNSTVAIIIESGLFYAACMVAGITYQLAIDPNSQGLVPFDFGPVMTLMSALAPTLIIVRVGYGKPVDSVQQMVSLQPADSVQENSLESRQPVNLQPQMTGSIHPEQLNEPPHMPVTGEVGDGITSG